MDYRCVHYMLNINIIVIINLTTIVVVIIFVMAVIDEFIFQY